jgi:hypothetical protein
MNILVLIIVMIVVLIGIGILRLKTDRPKDPQEEARRILNQYPHDRR